VEYPDTDLECKTCGAIDNDLDYVTIGEANEKRILRLREILTPIPTQSKNVVSADTGALKVYPDIILEPDGPYKLLFDG
jgi:hypothetical protein